MGNRAVVTIGTAKNSPCVYLHWNGGLASVRGFLKACKSLGKAKNNQEAILRLFNVAYAFMNNGQQVKHAPSVYLKTYGRADTDNGDNGLYLIDKGFNLIGRDYLPYDGYKEEIDEWKTADIYSKALEMYQAMFSTQSA